MMAVRRSAQPGRCAGGPGARAPGQHLVGGTGALGYASHAAFLTHPGEGRSACCEQLPGGLVCDLTGPPELRAVPRAWRHGRVRGQAGAARWRRAWVVWGPGGGYRLVIHSRASLRLSLMGRSGISDLGGNPPAPGIHHDDRPDATSQAWPGAWWQESLTDDRAGASRRRAAARADPCAQR